jgi:parvulin-like peptidyl-prolyl isomerase
MGDVTLLEGDIPLTPLRDIRKLFGDDFVNSLLELETDAWAGPVRSGYGIHLVYVSRHVAGRTADLNEVRETVKQDWLVERQQEVKDAAYAKIRERYDVTVEKPNALATAATAGGAAR